MLVGIPYDSGIQIWDSLIGDKVNLGFYKLAKTLWIYCSGLGLLKMVFPNHGLKRTERAPGRQVNI